MKIIHYGISTGSPFSMRAVKTECGKNIWKKNRNGRYQQIINYEVDDGFSKINCKKCLKKIGY